MLNVKSPQTTSELNNIVIVSKRDSDNTEKKLSHNTQRVNNPPLASLNKPYQSNKDRVALIDLDIREDNQSGSNASKLTSTVISPANSDDSLNICDTQIMAHRYLDENIEYLKSTLKDEFEGEDFKEIYESLAEEYPDKYDYENRSDQGCIIADIYEAIDNNDSTIFEEVKKILENVFEELEIKDNTILFENREDVRNKIDSHFSILRNILFERELLTYILP